MLLFLALTSWNPVLLVIFIGVIVVSEDSYNVLQNATRYN